MADSVLETSKPYVKIIEQPVSRGIRFRYEREKRYDGQIMGVNNTRTGKTYPTIQIVNHNGPYFVVVSCVTKEPPYRPHPHNLVGKIKEIANGICYFRVPENNATVSFPHLRVQCVRKKDMANSLALREQLKVDPFNTGFSHKAKGEGIDFNCIRLCFQVFLEGQVKDNFDIALQPVVSNPIYDKKANAELEIKWISHHSASVTGGKTILILCEKVDKKDIQVRFFCEKSNWEAIAEFVPPKIYKQHALVIKVPAYGNQEINEPIEVQVELRRLSIGDMSESLPFYFLASEITEEGGLRKKRLMNKETPRTLVLRHLKVENAVRGGLGPNAFTQSNNDRILKSELGNLQLNSKLPDAVAKTPFLHPNNSQNVNSYGDLHNYQQTQYQQWNYPPGEQTFNIPFN